MSPPRATTQVPHWFPRGVALVGGIFFFGFGLWAMADPEGFFRSVANFDPYNQHFIQDIGSFQIGLGSILLLSAILGGADALAIALVAGGIGSAAHTISHIIGINLGGTPGTDLPLFVLVTVLLLIAGWIRWRETAHERERGEGV